MKWLIFALRRCLRDRAFVLSLLAAALLIALAPTAGGSTGYPLPGVYDADGSDTARAICAALAEQSFVICQTEAELYSRVQSGGLDCGVVLLSGLEEKLALGDTEGAMLLVTAPATAMEAPARIAAAAVLYRYAAPYVAAGALEDQDVTAAEFAAVYESYFEGSLRFGFDVSTGSAGGAAPPSTRARSLTRGCAAVLLFALVMYGNLPVLGRGFDEMTAAVGLRRAVRLSLAPTLLLRMLLVMAAGAAGLAAAALMPGGSGAGELIFPVLAYVPALTVLSVLLGAVIKDEGRAQTAVMLLLLAGLALCPVFTDLALTIPAVQRLRLFAPAYWLWWAAERPVVWLLASLALLPAAAALLCLCRACQGRLSIKNKTAAGRTGAVYKERGN